jgi:hypothetical protein
MLKLIWDKGGEAEVIESDGDRIVVLSTTPHPPGRPLSAKTPDGIAYHVKVRGCQRQSETPLRYRVDGRLFNLEREPRAHLLQALQKPVAP